MDNLTHTLTGVLLARAGLSKLSPRAVWIAAIAANIPDIDVVSFLGGMETYFVYHRWATHAIVFAPVMGLGAVLLVAAAFRQKLPWFKAWLVAIVAVASHLLLDFTNPYGIRLWLPFSSAWPSLDITHVVDVWIWLILLAGCFWPMLSGLVSSEIGAKKQAGRGVALAALVSVALYDTGRWVLHARAVDTLQSRVYQGAGAKSAVVFPQTVNPLRWNGWVETEAAWLALNVDLAQEFDPTPSATYWKPESHPAINAVRDLRAFRVLSAFAKTPYWRVTPVEDPVKGSKVELIDLRFGRQGRQGFTASAIVDSSGNAIQSGIHF